MIATRRRPFPVASVGRRLRSGSGNRRADSSRGAGAAELHVPHCNRGLPRRSTAYSPAATLRPPGRWVTGSGQAAGSAGRRPDPQRVTVRVAQFELAAIGRLARGPAELGHDRLHVAHEQMDQGVRPGIEAMWPPRLCSSSFGMRGFALGHGVVLSTAPASAANNFHPSLCNRLRSC